MINLYRIPVTYKVSGFVYVQAESLDEAIEFVKEQPYDVSLPKNPDFVDDSLEIDGDKEEIIDYNY